MSLAIIEIIFDVFKFRDTIMPTVSFLDGESDSDTDSCQPLPRICHVSYHRNTGLSCNDKHCNDHWNAIFLRMFNLIFTTKCK